VSKKLLTDTGAACWFPIDIGGREYLPTMQSRWKTNEEGMRRLIEQLAQRRVVRFYARNDNLGCVIPYEYMHVEHSYEPDFLVRLNVPGKEVTVILEVKGYADDRTQQKHEATQRWLAAVNTWGKLGTWDFHVCRNPQTLDKELIYVQQQWMSALAHGQEPKGEKHAV